MQMLGVCILLVLQIVLPVTGSIKTQLRSIGTSPPLRKKKKPNKGIRLYPPPVFSFILRNVGPRKRCQWKIRLSDSPQSQSKTVSKDYLLFSLISQTFHKIKYLVFALKTTVKKYVFPIKLIISWCSNRFGKSNKQSQCQSRPV